MALMVTAATARPFTLVIDPGHGGKDPGCEGVNAKEKDITLKVSTLLSEIIQKKHGDNVKVVMTRTDDSFIPLNQRAQIANINHADLFLSIHVNSVDKNRVGRENIEGTQVYVCTPAKKADNSNMIRRYIKLIQFDNRGKKNEAVFEPGVAESVIAYELATNQRNDLSVDFAQIALKQLTTTAKRANRNVHPGPFQVLWSTTMPAVLVELDYMCNPVQEKFLSSEKGQRQCAEALGEAFNKYYKKYYNAD